MGALGLIALPYLGTFAFPYVFDDVDALVNNPAIRQLIPPASVFASLPDTTTWGRPLLAYSFAINYQLSGLEVWSYRLVNLLLHLANIVMLRSFLLLLFESPGGERYFRDKSAAVWATALAVLWGAHPLGTSVVTYTVQRAESLQVFFYFGTLVAVLRVFAGSFRRSWAATAVGLAFCGMFVKESMVTIPIVAALFVAVAYPSVWSSEQRARTLRFFALLCCSWIGLGTVMSVWPRSQSVGIVDGFGPLQSLLTQSEILFYYIRISVFPVGLQIDHWWPARTRLSEVWVPFSVLALGGAGLVGLWFRDRFLACGGLSWFIVLAPTSSFIPVTSQLAADHRAYLPLAFLLLFLAAVFLRVLERPVPVVPPRLCAGIWVIVLMGLLTLTTLRNGVYASVESVWSDVLMRQPRHARAMNNLGHVFWERGETEQAERFFRQGIEVAPFYFDSYRNLGVLLGERGDRAAAEENLLRSLELAPGHAESWANLGVVYAQQHRRGEAEHAFREAIRANPVQPAARFGLAVLAYQDARFGEAMDHVEVLLRYTPDYPQGAGLAAAIQRSMRFE